MTSEGHTGTSEGHAGRGTAALEDGARVDFSRLRSERRRACLAAMEANHLDALVLGREANARYVSGARRLWTSGARPFGPSCVVIAESGAVHVLSTWDEGVPPEIGHDQLFGMTWNEATLASSLAAVPGLAGSRRIGVDAMRPGAARLLAAVAPGADILDASGVLTGLRRVKTGDEQACIATSVAVAEAALSYSLAGLRAGTRGRDLTGRAAARTAELGVTTPDLEGRFWSTSPVRAPADGGAGGGLQPKLRSGSPPAHPGDEELAAGALVACQVGTVYAGYEGVVARTWVNGGAGGRAPRPTEAQSRLYERWSKLWGQLGAACRPGATGGDLLAAYERAGEPLPDGLVAHGVGLGMEPPLVGDGLPPDAGASTRLEPGMVMFVAGMVSDPEVGAVLAGETVLITGTGHEILTRHGRRP